MCDKHDCDHVRIVEIDEDKLAKMVMRVTYKGQDTTVMLGDAVFANMKIKDHAFRQRMKKMMESEFADELFKELFIGCIERGMDLDAPVQFLFETLIDLTYAKHTGNKKAERDIMAMFGGATEH